MRLSPDPSPRPTRPLRLTLLVIATLVALTNWNVSLTYTSYAKPSVIGSVPVIESARGLSRGTGAAVPQSTCVPFVNPH